jgi:hypothetical protein
VWPAPRWLLPRFVQLGRAETLDCPLYDSRGQPVAVTAGTFSLLDPEGVAVVDAAAVTVTAGVASYPLLSTFADDYTLPQTPWRERWVLDGKTYEREVHVCRVAPVAHLTTEELFRMHPQWRKQLQSARTSTTYGEPVEDAWNEMIRRLLGDNLLPQRTLNWWTLATVHKYWAASLVARDFCADNPNDNRWAAFADAYWKRSQEEYESYTKIQADADEDGIAENPGQLESVEPQLYLTNVPATWYPPGWSGGIGGGGGWWR